MNYYILMNVGIANLLYLIFGITGALFIVSGLNLLLRHALVMWKELHPGKMETGVLRIFIKFINSIFGYIFIAVLTIILILVITGTLERSNDPRTQAPDDPLSESIEEFRGDDLIYEGQKYHEYNGSTSYDYLVSSDGISYPSLMAEAFNSCDGIDKTEKIGISVEGYIDHGSFGGVFGLDNYTDDETYDHIVSIYTGQTDMLRNGVIKDLSSFLPIKGIVEYHGSCETLANTLDSGTDILSYWPELSYVKADGWGHRPSAELTEKTAVIYASSMNTNLEIPDAEEITVIGSNGTVTYTCDEFDYEHGTGRFTYTISQNGIFDLISEVGELYAVSVTDSNGEKYDLGYIPSDSEY